MPKEDSARARSHLAAVVTVSDGVSAGVRDDASGRAVAALLEGSGFEISRREVVPDEADRIQRLLIELADSGPAVIVTTGGTGIGPRDVTPEATRAVIDREAPGLAEEMRAVGRGSTPFAALSRGLAGIRGSALIVNLPGSERGAVESLSAILPVLPHALDLLAGHTIHGPADAGGSGHSHVGREGRARGTATGDLGPPATSHALDEELAARRHAGQEVVLATAVGIDGNPPCRLGQKILLGSNGAIAGTLGCAEFDDAAVADAAGVLSSRGPATRTYTHALGSIEVFLEPVLRRPTLVVLSATPVALHLMRWAGQLGFDPVLVEPRAERVTDEHREAGPVASTLDSIDVDDETSAVHTDHDAPGVTESVAVLLRSPARFVGVMGSARHVGPHLVRLREMGLGDGDLARIRTPVGIDLGARTAEEIALSILAGLIADRRGASAGWLDRRPEDVPR